ncbi:GNAT family N-acetyltransferase [Clostridium oceanicum]|uniref:GNAT family protein n=1 Tax=Clostridium oceanicum TaxID=1543 RepID=A0ABN1JK84_9CLOT
MEELITERLILRQWRKSDLKDLYEYAKSELVGPNAGWPAHKNEEESKKVLDIYIKFKDLYAIVLKSENKVIGNIGFHKSTLDENPLNLNQRQLGFSLNYKYWGREIMPEAVKCLLEYGFTKLNLDLIWCNHYDFNNNSKRVLQKCGFKYNFTKKINLDLLDNKEVTALYYSILKSEYTNN